MLETVIVESDLFLQSFQSKASIRSPRVATTTISDPFTIVFTNHDASFKQIRPTN